MSKAVEEWIKLQNEKEDITTERIDPLERCHCSSDSSWLVVIVVIFLLLFMHWDTFFDVAKSCRNFIRIYWHTSWGAARMESRKSFLVITRLFGSRIVMMSWRRGWWSCLDSLFEEISLENTVTPSLRFFIRTQECSCSWKSRSRVRDFCERRYTQEFWSNLRWWFEREAWERVERKVHFFIQDKIDVVVESLDSQLQCLRYNEKEEKNRQKLVGSCLAIQQISSLVSLTVEAWCWNVLIYCCWWWFA